MFVRCAGLWFLFTFLASLLDAGERHDGVRSRLLNGENLDGWQVTGCDVAVENGCLVLRGGDGFVRTDHPYRNFVLELEWRPSKSEKWDSGIYIRCQPPAEGQKWPDRYQINLLEGHEGNGIGLAGAESQGLIKKGEWNHFQLTVIGNVASLEINGQPAWTTSAIDNPIGHIGLQCEVPGGGQFEFREIYVTELGYESLFNGADLAGWEGGGAEAAACWSVEDGKLVCTGQPGPWLRCVRQYADFNLRLEYKLRAGGNSGVYVRVPEDGNHHGQGAGVEVQILDDADHRYAALEPWQYGASVYKIAAVRERVGRPPGSWNTLEINCRGSQYQVLHNGRTVVEADVREFPELAERQLRGYLGLQNHSEQVWFRNLRVGPAL